MMATAFFGYVLPWGQMSFWGATVITNLFSAIPVVGSSIATWLWGDFAVGEATLNRFFSLHYLLPFIIAGVVGLHIWALHVPGNNNPLGIDVKSPQDTVPFHPYYTVKDGFYLVLFVIFFAAFVFFEPDFFGTPDNYQPANPLVTPPDIVPEWYLLPYYAMLRSVPDKLMGVIVMGAAIVTLVFIPWLDTSRVRSCRFRPLMKQFFWGLVVVCVILGYCGAQSVEATLFGIPLVWVARITTLYYFAFFWLIMPIVGLIETPKKLPASISQSVLGNSATTSSASGRVRTNMRLNKILLGSSLLLGLMVSTAAVAAESATAAHHPKAVHFEFEGPFGTYDRGALQRGFQVYKEVCSSCHSLDMIAYRNLADKGGPEFTEPQARALAAAVKRAGRAQRTGRNPRREGPAPDPHRRAVGQIPRAIPQ